jgi:ABC-type dipeptide/oligopeptide/nickel transport system permease component
LSSLQIVGSLLVVAFVLGAFFGLLLLWNRRRQGDQSVGTVSLHLQTRS